MPSSISLNGVTRGGCDGLTCWRSEQRQGCGQASERMKHLTGSLRIEGMQNNRKGCSMNSITIQNVAARLRRCAEELAEIAETIGAAACAEVSPEKANGIEERYGAMAKSPRGFAVALARSSATS